MTTPATFLEANAPWIALTLLGLLAVGLVLRRRRSLRRRGRRRRQPGVGPGRGEPAEPGPDGAANGDGPG